MVVATQNPIEQQGTYPLPEAQLDRFLFKQTLGYPSARGGTADRRRATARAPASPTRRAWASSAVADPASIAAAPHGGRRHPAEPTRSSTTSSPWSAPRARPPTCRPAPRPRAAAMLALAARARAALDGRDYVIPDDVKALALPALRHRVILSPAAEIEGRERRRDHRRP